jgi:hypothetical protein
MDASVLDDGMDGCHFPGFPIPDRETFPDAYARNARFPIPDFPIAENAAAGLTGLSCSHRTVLNAVQARIARPAGHSCFVSGSRCMHGKPTCC